MTDEAQTRAVAVPQRQAVENIQPMFDTARFEHFQRAASALMHSSIMNPSIRGNSPQQAFSNLMLLADQSDRWKLPLIAIVQETSIVHDKLVFSGKLIAAALQSSLGIKLFPWFTGERGDIDYRVYLSDVSWDDLSDEELAALKPGVQIRGRRIVDGSVGEWRTFLKDGRTPNAAWTGAATQNQLIYRGSREWARRFESAHMLGVYGDDEIDQIQGRMDRARDVTPVAGLSTGFTKPAEAQAEPEVEDAVVEEVADAAAEAAAEPQDGQVDAKATADATEDDGQQQASEEGSAVEVMTDDEIEAWAIDIESAASCGVGLPAHDKWPQGMEVPEKVRAAALRGADAFDDAKELAYQQGKSGQIMTEIMPEKKAAKALKLRWDALRSEWNQGQADAKAEAAATDETAGDSDFDGDDASGDDVGDPWAEQLADLQDWASIKGALYALSQSEAWKAFDAEGIAEVRAKAWRRQAELIEAGKDRLDFINDLTAFRCWLETTTDTDAIEGNWQTLVRQPIYTGLSEVQQKSMAAAVAGRVEAIKAGKP